MKWSRRPVLLRWLRAVISFISWSSSPSSSSSSARLTTWIELFSEGSLCVAYLSFLICRRWVATSFRITSRCFPTLTTSQESHIQQKKTNKRLAEIQKTTLKHRRKSIDEIPRFFKNPLPPLPPPQEEKRRASEKKRSFENDLGRNF